MEREAQCVYIDTHLRDGGGIAVCTRVYYFLAHAASHTVLIDIPASVSNRSIQAGKDAPTKTVLDTKPQRHAQNRKIVAKNPLQSGKKKNKSNNLLLPKSKPQQKLYTRRVRNAPDTAKF